MKYNKNWVAKYPGQQPPAKVSFRDVMKNIGAAILIGLMWISIPLMLIFM